MTKNPIKRYWREILFGPLVIVFTVAVAEGAAWIGTHI